MIKSTGVRHIVNASSYLISECKDEILRRIRENPERPVLQIYEEVYTSYIRRLDGQATESESFVYGMPTAARFERSMYRARREVVPANPATQNEIDTGNNSVLII